MYKTKSGLVLESSLKTTVSRSSTSTSTKMILHFYAAMRCDVLVRIRLVGNCSCQRNTCIHYVAM